MHKYRIELFKDGKWVEEIRYYMVQKDLEDFDLFPVFGKRRNALYLGEGSPQGEYLPKETITLTLTVKPVIAYFDGSCQGEFGAMGFGCVIYSNDNVFEDFGHREASEDNNNDIAECIALEMVLDNLLKNPNEKGFIYGDCLQIINQVNGKTVISKKANYNTLAARCQEKLGLLPGFKLGWVPRKENKKADLLSRKAVPSLKPAYKSVGHDGWPESELPATFNWAMPMWEIEKKYGDTAASTQLKIKTHALENNVGMQRKRNEELKAENEWLKKQLDMYKIICKNLNAENLNLLKKSSVLNVKEIIEDYGFHEK